MAEPTPWQVANKKPPTYKKTVIYERDVYNFSHVTTTNGTNPAVTIPCDGPHAAGAVPPSSSPQVLTVVLVANGTDAAIMGSNLHQPGA